MRKILVTFNIPGSTRIPEVSRTESPYEIYVGSGLLEKSKELLQLSNYSRIIILMDGNLPKELTYRLVKPLENITTLTTLIVPPGEDNKTLATVGKVAEQMRDAGADRKSLIINFGGGVIGDMGGFIAGIYMRGIDFVQIPTTLLSQVDQSIGGKTGVDLERYKNILGLVIQPKAVVIDIDVLYTLPEKQIQSGLVEIIKHGMILDKDFFYLVTAKNLLLHTKDELIDILARNAEIKAHVITEDPTEKGLRKVLNFGHTIGHAIETLSWSTNNPLFHGEAVSIGIVGESFISWKMGLLKESEFREIEQVLKTLGVPTSYKGLEPARVRKIMQSDKKTEKGELNFSLLQSIGKCVYDQHPPEEIVMKAIEYVTLS